MNGTEMLLKSLGLGDAIEKAKEFARDGTFDQILKFATGVDAMNAKLDRLLYLLEGDKSNGIGNVLQNVPTGHDGSSDIRGGEIGGAGSLSIANAAPGAGASDGAGLPARIVEGSFERSEPVGQPQSSRDADNGCAVAVSRG